MSKASRYHDYLESVRLYSRETGEMIARIESEFESFGMRFMPSDPVLTPEEALDLAKWILEVFGEDI